MKKYLIALILLLPFVIGFSQKKTTTKDQYFVIRFYELTPATFNLVADYLQNTYIPQAHKVGIPNIGVYTPVATDTALYRKRIVVFIPAGSLEKFVDLEKQVFQSTGPYQDAIYSEPPYLRQETILVKAFKDMNRFSVPKLGGNKLENVYELRSYESATEKIFRNKVHMFNEGGEIVLFDKLGFNAVFYSEVVAGAHMPNLMYMTSFTNMESRNEHWKTFVADPDWKRMSGSPFYQKNVSKNTIWLLNPLPFSEL